MQARRADKLTVSCLTVQLSNGQSSARTERTSNSALAKRVLLFGHAPLAHTVGQLKSLSQSACSKTDEHVSVAALSALSKVQKSSMQRTYKSNTPSRQELYQFLANLGIFFLDFLLNMPWLKLKIRCGCSFCRKNSLILTLVQLNAQSFTHKYRWLNSTCFWLPKGVCGLRPKFSKSFWLPKRSAVCDQGSGEVCGSATQTVVIRLQLT